MPILLFFFVLTFVLTAWARGKYQKIREEEMRHVAASGLTGAALARRILEARGIEVVEIVRGRGLFADSYDPERKRLTLAPQHFSGSTYAALGIAAHEAGHVLQHRDEHRPLFWRVSARRATVWLSLPLLFLGIAVFAMPGLGRGSLMVVCGLWAIVAGYNLITLPVEVDASERARQVLDRMKPRAFSSMEERLGVERMMRAAASAHVDGVFTVLSWLGSWILPVSSGQPKPGS